MRNQEFREHLRAVVLTFWSARTIPWPVDCGLRTEATDPATPRNNEKASEDQGHGRAARRNRWCGNGSAARDGISLESIPSRDIHRAMDRRRGREPRARAVQAGHSQAAYR